jgi:lipoic acid synthetase
VKRLPVSCASSVPALVEDLNLSTVCRSAKCPNLAECWARGTATFMILGERCTRGCRFCAVDGGAPPPPDEDEPRRVGEAAKKLGLKFVVVTSVTRDDLADGGAGHFAATVEAVRNISGARVEVLTPDFRGRAASVETVMHSGCDVFGHNLETVPRLYEAVRPGSDFERSIEVLRCAAAVAKDAQVVKSGIMVGLGETAHEVEATLARMYDAGCRSATIGQYLSPGEGQLPVAEYVEPDRFEEYARAAKRIGFASVASGPFVRSSYMADNGWEQALGLTGAT